MNFSKLKAILKVIEQRNAQLEREICIESSSLNLKENEVLSLQENLEDLKFQYESKIFFII